MHFLPAPVDSELFKIKNRKKAREKLSLNKVKKIMLYAGRISYLKCSDILKDLIIKNPDIQFILIGRMMDPNIKNLNVKNIIYFEKKSSEELVDYYNASDLGFYMTRSGGGMGITAEELLSCGVPVIIPNNFELPEAEGIYQAPYDSDKVNQIVRNFFNLEKTEREKLRKKTRKFIEENFSYNALKEAYIDAHLK